MVATVQYLVHYDLSTGIFFRLMMHCIYCVHWVEFHGGRQAINKCNLKKSFIFNPDFITSQGKTKWAIGGHDWITCHFKFFGTQIFFFDLFIFLPLWRAGMRIRSMADGSIFTTLPQLPYEYLTLLPMAKIYQHLKQCCSQGVIITAGAATRHVSGPPTCHQTTCVLLSLPSMASTASRSCLRNT